MNKAYYSSKTLFNTQKNTYLNEINVNNTFNNFFKNTYEDNLKSVLDILIENKKEAHLMTLDILKEKNVVNEELNKINLLILLGQNKQAHQLELTNKDKKIFKEYSQVYQKIENKLNTNSNRNN
ncbi:hypothetical protein [Poseidonibacter lekithochrous]|uniref:hypothetical protein n=1 Tax=Poseidonibacter lekithochrous TaxID=1904463 RepID=UPI0008FC9FCB|nr:hypothetical protein [Poseidonibacter lekithochrous]QKJ21879.1 hypothetical protein ALEK_0576 [Poseidonibacter lekithochrous]